MWAPVQYDGALIKKGDIWTERQTQGSGPYKEGGREGGVHRPGNTEITSKPPEAGRGRRDPFPQVSEGGVAAMP